MGLQSIHSLTVELAAVISSIKPNIMERQFQCVLSLPPPTTQLKDPNSVANHTLTSNRTCEGASTTSMSQNTDSELMQGLNMLRLSGERTSLANDIGSPNNDDLQHGDRPHDNTADVLKAGENIHQTAHIGSQSELLDVKTVGIRKTQQPDLPDYSEVSSYSLLESFVRLWKEGTQGKVPANAFICAKNVLLMDRADDVQVSGTFDLLYCTHVMV